MAIRVANPGFYTSVQDSGRYGCAHLGVSPAGAADDLSCRIGNLLVGNDVGAPALEMTLLGATFEFDSSAVVSITGADLDCKVGGIAVPMWQAFEVSAGSVLSCGAMSRGIRSYLSVHGGFDVTPVMGSASTHFTSHIGGIDGRGLVAGDMLRHPPGHKKPLLRRLRADAMPRVRARGPIRVTRGPQYDWFGPEQFARFTSCDYAVSPNSDRGGLRLAGEALHVREQQQLLTEGVSLGAIQVPQDGQPIILFRDQQTTGGYPKIANVIAADLHRVGQLRPGDTVRFTEVSIALAVDLLRDQEKWLKGLFCGRG